MPPRALLILFAFCLSSFPRLLPLRVSSSRLPPLRRADGGVCLTAPRTPSSARTPSGRQKLRPARASVFKSAFVPLYSVKMHIPKSRRILRDRSSNAISRSPLSIRTLHSARNDPLRQRTLERPLATFSARKVVSFLHLRAALSRAWSRMTGVGNSLKKL